VTPPVPPAPLPPFAEPPLPGEADPPEPGETPPDPALEPAAPPVFPPVDPPEPLVPVAPPVALPPPVPAPREEGELHARVNAPRARTRKGDVCLVMGSRVGILSEKDLEKRFARLDSLKLTSDPSGIRTGRLELTEEIGRIPANIAWNTFVTHATDLFDPTSGSDDSARNRPKIQVNALCPGTESNCLHTDFQSVK